MKRRNDEGTINLRKDGRWEARTWVGDHGRRRRRSFYGATPEEARQALTRAQAAQDSGAALPPARATVGSFLQRWLASKERDLRPESYRRYREHVELHLVPALGHLRLAYLAALDVEECYAECFAKGLSGTTVQQIGGTLHKALKDAVRLGLLVRNVSDLAERPKRSTPEVAPLTSIESVRLLEAARGDEMEAFYTLALTTGMRLGELQALRWRYVSLERRRLLVVATYQGRKDGAPDFAPPKTLRSRREIVLAELAVDALRRHRAAQAAHRLQVGGLWRDYDVVFANGYGLPLDGNNLRSRSFRPLLARAGLPPMRFHNLRHGAATLLMAEGVPVKVISEMLGHSDIRTTLGIYAHALPAMQEQAASTMDRLFGAAAAENAR